MEKVIKNGQVAVLISRDYGAGWYSWNKNTPAILFDSRIVQKVIDGKHSEINEEYMRSIGYADVFCGGADQLEIEWVAQGSVFDINEYDGYESLHIIGSCEYIVA